MSAEDALFQRYGKKLAPGEIVFKEGDTGREMYVLQSGRVAITKRVRDLEKLLGKIGPGEFFGEMAIIGNRPRNATAVVEEEARVLVIDSQTFESMIRSNAEIAVRMIKKLADRLTEADAQIESLLIADPASRVVQALINAGQSDGRSEPEGTVVDFAVRERSRAIGVGEVAVRVLLDRLTRSGLIRCRGDEVILLSLGQLRDYQAYLEMKWKFGE